MIQEPEINYESYLQSVSEWLNTPNHAKTLRTSCYGYREAVKIANYLRAKGFKVTIGDMSYHHIHLIDIREN